MCCKTYRQYGSSADRSQIGVIGPFPWIKRIEGYADFTTITISCLTGFASALSHWVRGRVIHTSFCFPSRSYSNDIPARGIVTLICFGAWGRIPAGNSRRRKQCYIRIGTSSSCERFSSLLYNLWLSTTACLDFRAAPREMSRSECRRAHGGSPHTDPLYRINEAARRGYADLNISSFVTFNPSPNQNKFLMKW